MLGTGRCVYVSAYDVNDNPIPSPIVTFHTDSAAVIRIDSDGRVTAVGDGTRRFWATIDGVDNNTQMTVFTATGVVVEPIPRLERGERHCLKIEYTTASGPVSGCLIDAEVDPTNAR